MLESTVVTCSEPRWVESEADPVGSVRALRAQVSRTLAGLVVVMPPLMRSLALVAFALAASHPLAGARPARAEPAPGYRATVVSVGDGDTLRVSTGDGSILVIRLACIDAPETSQNPWGLQSRAYLTQRLPRGREVTILPHTTDRYGRTVAEVISDLNINLVMVEDGQAFAYRRHLSGCDAKEFLAAEHRACRQRHGVWQVEGGITRPWVFRRSRRASVPVHAAPGRTGDEDDKACASLP